MQKGKLLIFSCDDSNMRYATGLNLHEPFIWARFGEKEYILVNGLEYPTVKKEARDGVKVIRWDEIELDNLRITGRKKNLADIACAFLLSYNVTQVAVPENTWAQHMETFREHNLLAKTESPFFPERIIKTQEEVKAIKQTGLVVKKAYKHIVRILKESTVEWDDTLHWEGQKITSEFLKQEIEKIFIDNNCSSMESIVSCGDDSAEPHNKGSGDIYAGKPIVIDLFPRDASTGYYFDMTRTVVKGTPSKELKEMYDAVKKAQLAGIQALSPGKVSEVHEKVAETLAKAGFETTDEEGFIHSTGHGLGIDVHEPPRIGKNSEDILKAGMVVTVEPGLYYKELGGVRIEDTLLITKTGCTNLTNLPKVLVIR